MASCAFNHSFNWSCFPRTDCSIETIFSCSCMALVRSSVVPISPRRLALPAREPRKERSKISWSSYRSSTIAQLARMHFRTLLEASASQELRHRAESVAPQRADAFPNLVDKHIQLGVLVTK